MCTKNPETLPHLTIHENFHLFPNKKPVGCTGLFTGSNFRNMHNGHTDYMQIVAATAI
jgi:hypothetical protein